jgi:methyl acetate hydrolase
MSARLDQLLDDAVGRRDMPFAVAAVASQRETLWQGNAGEAAPGVKAGPDTLFRIMSMTKAVGATAALILIDRGRLELETPVASVLPEFAAIRVLESIGAEGPVLRPPRTTCTVRHLLTHRSGFAYETYDAKQAAYQRLPGSPNILDGTVQCLNYPLMFDPGEGFVYGIGIDWIGRLVERIDGRRIDQFCQEEIFRPLGLSSTLFELDGEQCRLASVNVRAEDGGFTEIEYNPPTRPEVYGMGFALYSTASDYIRFLQMVLNNGELDGNRVLSPAAVDLMKTNQSGNATVPVFRSVLPGLSADVELFPAGTEMTWTAAFLRNETDIPDRRAGGSLTWAGFLNTHYWIDPANNIAAVLMTQTLPFCDPGYMRAYEAYERLVYQLFGSSAHAPGSTATAAAR